MHMVRRNSTETKQNRNQKGGGSNKATDPNYQKVLGLKCSLRLAFPFSIGSLIWNRTLI